MWSQEENETTLKHGDRRRVLSMGAVGAQQYVTCGRIGSELI